MIYKALAPLLVAMGALCAFEAADASGDRGVSPDGRIIAGGDDDVIELTDVATGKSLIRVAGAHNNVRDVAFSPDGKMLASCGDDEMIRLWEAPSMKEGLRISAPQDPAPRPDEFFLDPKAPLNTVAFSPDGRRIAAAGHAGHRAVRIWEVADGREVIRLDGARDAVYSVAFSPDGRHLAAGSGDGHVHIWDLATGQEIHRLPCQGQTAYSIAFSPDGTVVAAACGDGMVHLWDPATGALVRRLSGTDGCWLYALAFSTDGRLLAAAGSKKEVRIWEAATGLGVRRLRVRFGDVWSLEFAGGDRLLFARCSRGDKIKVQFWELRKDLNTAKGLERRVVP